MKIIILIISLAAVLHILAAESRQAYSDCMNSGRFSEETCRFYAN